LRKLVNVFGRNNVWKKGEMKTLSLENENVLCLRTERHCLWKTKWLVLRNESYAKWLVWEKLVVEITWVESDMLCHWNKQELLLGNTSWNLRNTLKRLWLCIHFLETYWACGLRNNLFIPLRNNEIMHFWGNYLKIRSGTWIRKATFEMSYYAFIAWVMIQCTLIWNALDFKLWKMVYDGLYA
jgi:hypothetical protein